jgi:hypothetical protein
LDSLAAKHPLEILKQYQILVSSGPISGFVVQAAELDVYGSLSNFAAAIRQKTQVNLTRLNNAKTIHYQAMTGDKLVMQYDATDLRCRGSINGSLLDYAKWADGAVYQSPYVEIKNGIMRITDGKEGYVVDCNGERPVFKTWTTGTAVQKR